MANHVQINGPSYFTSSSVPLSSSNSILRTVVLTKQPDKNSFGVYIGEDVPSGLYIVTVERNSPATAANIQPGDRVIAINGQQVSSMKGDLKETIRHVATFSQTLTLTLQSSDLFQTLNIPLVNNSVDNTNHQSLSTASRLNTDLEKYVKSILGDDNIQILSTSDENQFTFAFDSLKKPSTNTNISKYNLNNTFPRSQNHHHHRHHPSTHSRRSKKKHFETKETQTTQDDIPNENVYHTPGTIVPSSQYIHRPTEPEDKNIQQLYPKVNVQAHMQQEINRNNEFQPVSTIPNVMTPLESIQQPINEAPQPPASPVAHPILTNNTENRFHDSARPNISTISSAESRSSPPPYTPVNNPVVPPISTDAREIEGQRSYNARPAQENPQIDPTTLGSNIREVHLHRSQDFDGFGFHLQYNNLYYLIQKVEENSPALQADLRANDVIHSINQQSTTNMPHGQFVQIVNANSHVAFVVQPLDNYLQANPHIVRRPRLSLTNTNKSDNEKPKGVLSKAFGKMSQR